MTTPLANTLLSMGYNGASLTEGPYFDGQSQNRLLDHVYTYFDHGLPQAVLTPYVDTEIWVAPFAAVHDAGILVDSLEPLHPRIRTPLHSGLEKIRWSCPDRDVPVTRGRAARWRRGWPVSTSWWAGPTRSRG